MQITIIFGKTKLKQKEFLEKLKNFSEKNKVIIQALNSDMIVSEEHLLSAVLHSLRTFETKENITKSIENEILVYASCERQIKNAIEKLGIKDENVALAIIGKYDEKKLIEFLEIEKVKFEKKEKEIFLKFGITKEEISSAENPYELILEKIALLDINK